MKAGGHYVYTLLDGEGVPIYVGRTANVATRIRGHYSEARGNSTPGQRKAEWFFRTRSLLITGPYTYDMSYRIECGRIEHLKPIGNIRGVW